MIVDHQRSIEQETECERITNKYIHIYISILYTLKDIDKQKRLQNEYNVNLHSIHSSDFFFAEFYTSYYFVSRQKEATKSLRTTVTSVRNVPTISLDELLTP